MTDSWYRWDNDTLLIRIRVQPRSNKDEIPGIQDNSLRVRLTSPPTDGKANAHLIRLVASLFDVPKTAVSIVSGTTGRQKRVAIRSPRKLPFDIPPRHTV